jgi:hypothetical protein
MARPLGKPLLSALVAVGSAAALLATAVVVRALIGDRPYHMTILPTKGRALVEISHPASGLIAPRFRVDLVARHAHRIVLRSKDDAIPGGSIELADTTSLPGRFRIRIGGTCFEVTEQGVIVDGEEIPWCHKDP